MFIFKHSGGAYGYCPRLSAFAELHLTSRPTRHILINLNILTLLQRNIKKRSAKRNHVTITHVKTCTNCHKIKSEKDFYYKNKDLGKFHAQCKVCYSEKRRIFYKEHYFKYGSEYRARAIARKRRLKNNLRKALLEYLKDKACVHCGISDVRVLEFDHINPATKSFGIAQAITRTLQWENVLEEISKCQILCANCHKIKTAEQQGWYKHTSA